jgi:hypothetical protein
LFIGSGVQILRYLSRRIKNRHARRRLFCNRVDRGSLRLLSALKPDCEEHVYPGGDRFEYRASIARMTATRPAFWRALDIGFRDQLICRRTGLPVGPRMDGALTAVLHRIIEPRFRGKGNDRTKAAPAAAGKRR